MNIDEDHTAAGKAGAWGSLERVSFLNDDSGEKSLLTLIEERRATGARDRVSESRGESPAERIDDIDEEDRTGLDHLMMRLGGNGF